MTPFQVRTDFLNMICNFVSEQNILQKRGQNKLHSLPENVTSTLSLGLLSP